MSVINSGLGWKCDSDYFVNEADAELAIVSTDTAYKALQGAAIAAQITNGNSTQLFLISTVENNAKLKMNSSLRTVYSVSVGGETWYISMSYMSGSVTSDYPLITTSKGETLNDTTPENLAKIIAEIIEAADVVFAKKIPTVDYIHQYIEGVEAETASRVNGVKNMITPVFDSSTIYAVGDYCIYNNGLYKCTTAHTGAWSANDFTSVNVMSEIQNASGEENPHRIVYFEDYGGTATVTFPPGDTENVFYGEVRGACVSTANLIRIFAPFVNTNKNSNTNISSYTSSSVGAINQGSVTYQNNELTITSSIVISRNKNTFTVKSLLSGPAVADIYAIFA